VMKQQRLRDQGDSGCGCLFAVVGAGLVIWLLVALIKGM
jgi:hypothetical protein